MIGPAGELSSKGDFEDGELALLSLSFEVTPDGKAGSKLGETERDSFLSTEGADSPVFRDADRFRL